MRIYHRNRLCLNAFGFESPPSATSIGEEEKVYGNRVGPCSVQVEVFEAVTQVCLVGFVCFMCPGMFNVLTDLGAGGQVDATNSTNSNAAHYAIFAFFAFFSGSVGAVLHRVTIYSSMFSSMHNVLGPRLCLVFGTIYTLLPSCMFSVVPTPFSIYLQYRAVQQISIPVQATLSSSLELY